MGDMYFLQSEIRLLVLGKLKNCLSAMKFIATLFSLILGVLNSIFGQSSEVKYLIDTSITIMKNNAVNRNKVDWTKIQKDALAQAVNKQNAYQIGPIYRMLFKSLNDFHGAFFCWDSTYKWYRQEPEQSDSIKNEWKKGVFIRTDVLEDNIGYLRVPYMSGYNRDELDKKAQQLNDSLCVLFDQKVTGIIVDLRLNGGGTMYPMMLGLEQLLGNGIIGSFETDNPQNWVIKNNSFFLDTNLLASIVPKCKMKQSDMPVVVLIGQGTGSSGEFLAMAFKKRKNTLFLGTATAGYVTTTKGFKINDAVTLLLSTGYGRDRGGEIYYHALYPDIFSKAPDSFNDIRNDEKVQAAAKWLKAKG